MFKTFCVAFSFIEISYQLVSTSFAVGNKKTVVNCQFVSKVTQKKRINITKAN
jgi:hypothetical protein